MSLHAVQRRRLYQAMLKHPEGVTSKDFAAFPAIDGDGPIPRVAARIGELRDEHRIPFGVKDPEGFAVYRLEDRVQPAPSGRVATREGWIRVVLCHGCLSVHGHGFRCPHGGRVEELLSGTGPMGSCDRQLMEERHAA